MEKEFKLTKFEVKQLDEETGIITGYAATFNKIDSYNDVIMPGAFKKTLKENKGRVGVFYMHNYKDWIGMGQKAQEDDTGLLVEAKLNIKRSPLAQEVFSLLQMAHEAGRPAGMSIGFAPVKWQMAKEVRQLHEVALYEYSVTPPSFQAGRGAIVTDMKTDDSLIDWSAVLGIDPALLAEILKREAAKFERKPDTHLHLLNDALDKALITLRR